MSDAAELSRPYEEMFGFVPPRIAARLEFTGEIDPELTGLLEDVRRRILSPPGWETKDVQLVVFAILLLKLSESSAALHALAARRAGATWEDLQAVANIAFLYGGWQVANLSAAVLRDARDKESANEHD